MATAHDQPKARPLRQSTALFDTHDYSAANGIGAYGGRMFEQGPGRGQLRYLASCSIHTHPTTRPQGAPTCSLRRAISHARR